MKKKYFIVLLLFFLKNFKATVEIQLEAAATAKAFDRASGTLYLGLDGGNEKAISKIDRYSGSGDIQLTGIATNATLNNASIEFLKISGSEGDTNPYLIIVKKSNLGPLKQTKIILATKDGQIIHELETDINDASGAAIIDGIVNIEVNNNYIFAAVKANAQATFGIGNSGIALIEIDKINNKLILKDATTGSDGNRAKLLNAASTEIKHIGDVDFTFQPNNIVLHWDQRLERLYIGVNIKTNIAVNNGGISVVTAYINSTTKILNFVRFVSPHTLFITNPNLASGQIIGVRKGNTHLFIKNIKTMHPYGGPSYLIVNAEVGAVAGAPAVTNALCSLPLINDPTNLATHGILATKNLSPDANSNYKFTTLPATAANLHVSFEFNAFFAKAHVGNFWLPVNETTTISDIEVINNAVYVSTNAQQDALSNESGIFRSQMFFDETAYVSTWSPWIKRAFPYNSFTSKNITNVLDQAKVKFFSVDAKTGSIWVVDGNDAKTLATTTWTKGDTQNSLTKKLNESLSDGCFSVLDIDATVNGISTDAPGRYALFGGNNKVVFAKIARSKGPGSPFNRSLDFAPTVQVLMTPQTITQDFSNPAHYKETSLPSEAGAVLCLEYSKRVIAAGAQNYFFAGTQNGLYVFADSTTGGGFAVSATVDDLNSAPFSTGSWRKINGIEGQVIAVKSSGNGPTTPNSGSIYVLTFQLTQDPEAPFKSVIYRIAHNTTVAAMEANIFILGESQVTAGLSDFSDVLYMTGLEIAVLFTTTEQIILSTNNGLFRSVSFATGGTLGALSQAGARWFAIPEAEKVFYSKLLTEKAPGQSTFWSIKINNALSNKTKQEKFAGSTTFPTFFPNLTTFLNNETFFPSLEYTTNFWTDEGRRFFLIRETNDNNETNQICLIPFNSTIWNVNSEDPPIIRNPVIHSNGTKFFNWIKEIGSSGIIMAGTNNGVVALE